MKRGGIISREKAEQYGLHKVFFWVFVIILLTLSYLILRPYFIALISAFIFAYLVRPLHKFFERKKFPKALSAALSIFVVLLILIVPFVLLVGSVVDQTSTYVNSGSFGVLIDKVSSITGFELNRSVILESGSFVSNLLSSFVSGVPHLLVSLLVMLFGMFYILYSWDELSVKLKTYIPFKNRDEIVEDVSRITNVLIYGTLLIAFIEFVIAAVGFYFLGIKFYLILASLVFFFAFIPALGPTIVWVPLAIYYFATGQYGIMIGILFMGAVLSLLIDTIVKSRLLGGRAKINPFIMLVGILGGISVFGVFGFIIGPLILAYTVEILSEAAKS